MQQTQRLKEATRTWVLLSERNRQGLSATKSFHLREEGEEERRGGGSGCHVSQLEGGGVTERQMKSLAKSSKSFHWHDKETAESLSHIKTCEVESQCELLY